jgi:hypothetical protein
MDDDSFEFARVRGQLVWVRVGASLEEIEEALARREARAEATAAIAVSLPTTFARDDPRPLLLIDVDGVVCPYGDELADPAAAGIDRTSVGYLPVWLSRGIAGRMKLLGKSFQLVWCTSWEDQAAESLAPHLQLPAMPVIHFDEPVSEDGHWKWPAIDAFVGGHPFAWIDDELGRADFARAERRPIPTRLVRIEGSHGLEDSHVEELQDFAEAVRAWVERAR